MIKELTHEEAARLRQLVKNRFLQSPFNGAGFRISQHRASYIPLADDIIRVVPDGRASVTTNRLRKLFYYTDPAICAADKLEKPSFGSDFIEALFKYVKKEPRIFPWKWLWRGAALLLLLAGVVSVWQWTDPQKYWEESFDDVSVEGLKSRGWEILDYEPATFGKQLRPGCWTAYTLRGDYWFTPPDSPIITNLLTKKINSKSFKATFKLVGFNPTQDFQQAGIFLLDENKNRAHNIRVTFASCASCIPSRQTIQIIKREHGTAYEKSHPMVTWSEEPPKEAPIPQLWIQVLCENGRFRFYHHAGGDEFSSFADIGDFDFDFQPHYVAVAAFRGIRHSQGAFNNSEAIPAFFDYLKVEPLPE